MARASPCRRPGRASRHRRRLAACARWPTPRPRRRLSPQRGPRRRRRGRRAFRGDDEDHVGGTLADRATDPVGQLGGRVLGERAVTVVRDRDAADAEDGGGQLRFPGARRLESRAARVLPGGLAAGQAEQAEAGAGPAGTGTAGRRGRPTPVRAAPSRPGPRRPWAASCRETRWGSSDAGWSAWSSSCSPGGFGYPVAGQLPSAGPAICTSRR